MMGPEKDPGVNLRAVEELFNVTKQRQNVSVSITANMLEVYNENVKDLLRDAKATDSQQINIRIGDVIHTYNFTNKPFPVFIRRFIKRNATILVTMFFQSTRTDEHSSTKFYIILRRQTVPFGPVN